MKSLNSDKARRIRVRPVLAYPAVTVALVVSVALALTPFGTSQVMALGAATIPMETTAPTATGTSSPSTTTPTPTETTAPTATSTTTPSPAPVPSASTVAAPGNHHVLARIEGALLQANYLPVDQPVLDASRFQAFRVRFRLHNAGTAAITTTPRLEYRPAGAGSFLVVPEESKVGVPFHVAREWVPSLGLSGGTMQGPLGEDIAVADLRIGDDGGLAVKGHHSMGANPDQPITLPSYSYTEQEFTLKVSMDAEYLTGYEFRITNGGTPLTGTDVATIRLGAPPALVLSPGQRQGIDVGGSQPAKAAGVVAAGSAFPAVFAASSAAAPATSSVVAASSAAVSVVPGVLAVSRPSTVRYPLVASALSAATVFSTDVHGPYATNSGQCAICHRGHTAKAPNLLARGSSNNLGSQSALCLACHDGTGANSNVQAQYSLTRPVNNAATREYYSHDAVAATPVTPHTESKLDEFGGVSNRHSECADCHNSHQATVGATRDSAQNADGWDASRRLEGVSGVKVDNSPTAGVAPVYTFLSGVDTNVVPANAVTREYQLCFKCHSGFTTLTDNTGLKPSKYALDKAVEFNPANPSFHPVEAVGKNQTTKMADSLAGTSPYKMWNFTIGSTIRCLNCHASGTTPDTTPTPLPQPGSVLAPHTSSNRGILLKNYKDRVLKPRVDVVVGGVVVDKAAYNAGDFALCYMCHAEAPFSSETSTATNFGLHGYHITKLAGMGSTNTDIDTPGAGGGNAICAECHFRLHSTTNKVGTQAISGSRLVNFAPNVQAYGGVIAWTPGATIGRGSCTLTCHGISHTPKSY